MNNIVYDMVLLEQDRIQAFRMKDLDIYYKDHDGEFKVLGEAYDESIQDLISQTLKKKKMRYLISFVDGMDVFEEIKPSSNRMLRFFVKVMGYGNKVSGYSLRDLQNFTEINMRYVLNAISELCEKDIIRFTVHRAKRTYMVNPIYFYKGTMKKLFYNTGQFDKFPRRNAKLEEIQEVSRNIFE